MAEQRIDSHTILIVADHPREPSVMRLAAELAAERSLDLSALRVSNCSNCATSFPLEPSKPADRTFYARTFGRR